MLHSRYKLEKRMISNILQKAIPVSLKMGASSIITSKASHACPKKIHDIPNFQTYSFQCECTEEPK